MRLRRIDLICVIGAAAILAGARPALTQADSPPSMGPSMPSDIDPQSGFRLALPKREDLDEAGKAHYDRATAPGASIAGLRARPGSGSTVRKRPRTRARST